MHEEPMCDGEEGRLPWFTSLTGTIRWARSVDNYSPETKWKDLLSFTSMQPWGQQVEVWPQRDTFGFPPASWLKAEEAAAFMSHAVQVMNLWHRRDHSSSLLVCWRHSGNTTSHKDTYCLVHFNSWMCACGPVQDNWWYYPLRGSCLLHAAHSTFNG